MDVKILDILQVKEVGFWTQERESVYEKNRWNGLTLDRGQG